MKPETTNSYDHLKITQVELPPNLFVYGQPVNLHPAYNYDPANAPPNGFLPVFALQQPVDPLLKEDVELKNFVRRNGACFYYTLCILAILAIFGIIRFITQNFLSSFFHWFFCYFKNFYFIHLILFIILDPLQ